jgi:2,4-dienoyl-CoA reductase-like NADH-dependent reductase (Old Yellow Enzyme family)
VTPPLLLTPLELRGARLRNRIGMSPMCMYSSTDGFASDWHVQHLVSRAVGGAGIVILEATAVEPEGRISPNDLGIWSDEHVPALTAIVEQLHAHGTAAGIQLAHAGRKACTARPWDGGAPLAPDDPQAWRPVGPSPVAFDEAHQVPHELTDDEVRGVIASFVAAARRAVAAGFDLIELHAAHGYLLHEFLSPLANRRADAWGGDFDSRTRFLRTTVDEVRAAIPDEVALAVRISATDHVDGGWTLDESVRLAPLLAAGGVDLVDCSSGGLHPAQRIDAHPGYQVPFAAAVRAAGIPTAAVGIITEPAQAEQHLQRGDCDLVLLGRELLRDPYWPQCAAGALGVDPAAAGLVPPQYLRAVRRPKVAIPT